MGINENVFTFDIEESMYFKQDQKVQNMLNLSLDPEITIQKYDDHVSIRGVLELSGEYILDPARDELEIEEDYTRQYITDITEGSNNYNEFSHLIPVQISVPLYRVKNFEDMTAEITEFDYEISDKEHLLVTAQLSIYGIDQSTDAEERKVESFIEESFEFDAVIKDIQEEEQEEEKDRENQKAKTILPSLEEKVLEVHLEEQKEEEETRSEGETPRLLDEKEEDVDEEQEEIKSVANFLSTLFKSEEETRYSKIRLCIVQTGDTIEKIAERFELPTLQILQYNQLDDSELSPGELLYIPESKRKAK